VIEFIDVLVVMFLIAYFFLAKYVIFFMVLMLIAKGLERMVKKGARK